MAAQAIFAGTGGVKMKIEQRQWSTVSGWQGARAAPSLGASAQMVLLFGTPAAMMASGSLELCRKSYPSAHLFGCTTAGEIQGADVRDDTVAITAVAFDSTRVAAAQVGFGNAGDSFEAGQKLVRSLDPNGLRHLFVLSEGLQVNGSELVRGINAALPGGVTVSGGFAGDGDRLRETLVWCDGEPEQRSVAALGFYGDRFRAHSVATGLWGQFGPDRLISKSKDNVLYEFDGRSALALYKEYLGDYAQGLPATGLLFPLCLFIRDTGHSVLRAILAVDEAEQSITFAGNVPEGAHARMMMGNAEQLIDDTLVAARDSRAALEDDATALCVLVSCNGRRHVLNQRIEEEVEAVREVLGEQAIVTGFYSYGEIAPVAATGSSELHNETMSITTFAEM
jgi:hypothetical protein